MSRRASNQAADNFRWLDVSDTGRALVIRNRADHQFLAVELQHDRIMSGCQSIYAMVLMDSQQEAAVRLMIDVDFFLLSLRRLLRICELVRRSKLPTLNLRQPIRDFENQTVGVASLRDVLEHLDDTAVSGRGGIGYGLGPDGVNITFGGAQFDTFALLEAARGLHAAIRTAIDPLAVQDPHGGYPIIALPDPTIGSTK